MITEQEESRYAALQQIALKSARTGDTEMLASMIDAGLPVNLTDEKGNSLLMLASYHGHLETTGLLLDCGADTEKSNDRNQTPLAGVAFKGGLDLVKRLVDGGADPVADQGGGRLPIHFAALFGHGDIVSYLESISASDKPKRLRALAGVSRTIRRLIGK